MKPIKITFQKLLILWPTEEFSLTNTVCHFFYISIKSDFCIVIPAERIDSQFLYVDKPCQLLKSHKKNTSLRYSAQFLLAEVQVEILSAAFDGCLWIWLAFPTVSNVGQMQPKGKCVV